MKDNIKEEFKKGENETEKEYCHRMARVKDALDLTWFDIAEICNKELGIKLSGEGYRSRERNYGNDIADVVKPDLIVNSSNKEDIEELIRELKLERAKLADERTSNNAILRRISRENTIKEIAKEAAGTIGSKVKLATYNKQVKKPSSKSGILLIGDWHYGLEVNSVWNKFSPEIAKERIGKLRDEVFNLVEENGIKDITVINLGDLISGRIHAQLRINNRIDAVTQIMEVSELLAQFLTDLSSRCFINYYDTMDNHSRLEPNLKDSLDLESLCRITTWYIAERLEDNKNINVNVSNRYSDDIVTCEVRKYKVAAVHGDNDKPAKVINNLSMLTADHYDLICTAHLHHFAANEQNFTRMIENGSLIGTDDYAEKLRLTSKPSQTFIVADDKSVTRAIYIIDLN